MAILWVQGVVKNGQVVLDPPLDLPDGTVLTVTRYDPGDDPRPQEPTLKLNEEEFLELSAFLSGKKSWDEWATFEARLKEKYGSW
jgi:hypothetical protein